MTESPLAARFAAVRARIERACVACGRDPAAVQLLAVSKTHPAATVRAALALGQREFGENRVQELAPKAAELDGSGASWHMIGSLQTNKVRVLLEVPDMGLLHSLDRRALADALEARLAASDRTLSCLLQINAAPHEPAKHGVLPEEAGELLDYVLAGCPHLAVDGVMAMAPLHGDPGAAFVRVAALVEELRDRSGLPLATVSTGMSSDLEAAIGAGSTLVRVGTALFGPRLPG